MQRRTPTPKQIRDNARIEAMLGADSIKVEFDRNDILEELRS